MEHTGTKTTTCLLLIALEQAERLFACGWPPGSRPKLEKQVSILRGQLGPGVLEVFDDLRGRFQDPIVPVIYGVCQGCHVALTGEVLAQMRKEEGVARCGNCQRILYPAFPDVEQQEPRRRREKTVRSSGGRSPCDGRP